MNVKVGALLTVRIGINTGSPIITGVLGTDRPTFGTSSDPRAISGAAETHQIQRTEYIQLIAGQESGENRDCFGIYWNLHF
jgi:hypothetical protein